MLALWIVFVSFAIGSESADLRSSRENIITSNIVLDYEKAKNFCRRESLTIATRAQTNSILDAVRRGLLDMPNAGLWICSDHCSMSSKKSVAGVLEKSGEIRPPKKRELRKVVCLRSKILKRKKRHAGCCGHHRPQNPRPQDNFGNQNNNEEDPFGFGQQPQTDTCSDERKEAAANKCSGLKRNEEIFEKCTKAGILKTDFRLLFNQCILDICLTGASDELQKKITCDKAKSMADKCEEEGVKITGWREIFKCPKEPPPPQPESGKPKTTCDFPSEKGPCKASHQRFYFNRKEGSCMTFTYGGCGGNANNFLSFFACLEKCHENIKLSQASCPGNQLAINTIEDLKVMRALLLSRRRKEFEDYRLLPKLMRKVVNEFAVFVTLVMQVARQDTNDAAVLKIRMSKNLNAIYGLITEMVLLHKDSRILKALKITGWPENADRDKNVAEEYGKKLWNALNEIFTKPIGSHEEKLKAVKGLVPLLLKVTLKRVEQEKKRPNPDAERDLAMVEKQKFNKLQMLLENPPAVAPK